MEVLTQIKEFLSKIEYDQNTAMIWDGDFNVIFDKRLDADGGNSTLKIQSLTKILMLMAENELCNIFSSWRAKVYMVEEKPFQATKT